MKFILTVVICFSAMTLLAQQQSSKQYILIVRSKAHVTASPEAIKTNILHWQAYMGELGKKGKIAGGYRLPADGVMITGKDKVEKEVSYSANDEEVSSFLIINAADLAEASKLLPGALCLNWTVM